MRRVVFCWEAGGGHGHLFRMLLLAAELKNRGVEPVFVVKEISTGVKRLIENNYRVLQAPMVSRNTPRPAQATVNNFADILLGQGFNNINELSGLLKAWRDTVELIAPSLIITDFAPTALLATREMRIPRIIYGDPFGTPLPRTPFPSLRPWSQIPNARLMRSDTLALHNANESLSLLGMKPLTSLAEIHTVERNYLCCFEELDPYGKRPQGHYVGNLFDSDYGAPPVWPEGKGKKIFVYIGSQHPVLKPLLEAISQLPVRCIAYLSGAAKDASIEKNIHISARPIAIAQVMQEADCFACGGHGTVSASLIAGKPVLLLPSQLEQRILATRVEAMQCGFHIPPHSKRLFIKEKLTALLTQTSITENSHRFAQRYADFDRQTQIAHIADELLQLI